MEFGILGPIRVADRSGEIDVRGAKPRTTLAMLLLHGNRTVSIDQLVDCLWADDPPHGARMAVQGHIKRLRRMLGAEFATRLHTKPPGYRLEVAEGELDLCSFQDLTGRGRSAAAYERWEEAADCLARALALWRGESLQDVPQSPCIRHEAERLSELRLQTREWRIDADMRLGRDAELVAELRQLTAEHPLRERFHGQLMLALYRCGRQAEALNAFQAARTALVAELGVEPGAHLQELHRQILQAEEHVAPAPAAPQAVAVARDAASARRPQGDPPAAGGRRVPNQLPADIRDFTGRDHEIAKVLGVLDADRPPDGPASVPMVVIAGPGGMGKTALAVHIAHRLARRYPDGRLYVAMQGSSTAPACPDEVLCWLLRTLGVDPVGIPTGFEERAALYRSLLAGQRLLIVLDDVADAAQMHGLLPGTPGCAVMVTTRHGLPGVDGANRIFLSEMDSASAQALIAKVIGQERAAAEPEAVASLAQKCAYLPLALRIAAARLAVRPSWTVRDVVDSIGDHSWRMDLLSVDGSGTRLSLALSHGSLSPEQARAFRLLAASRIRNLSLDAVNALLGTGVEESRRLAERLVDLHLLRSPGQHRYSYSELHYLYAQEELKRNDPQERIDAVRRLTACYLEALREAGHVIRTGVPQRRFTDPARAGTWLEREQDNIKALIEDLSAPPLSDPDAVAELSYHLPGADSVRTSSGTCAEHPPQAPPPPRPAHTAERAAAPPARPPGSR